MNRIRYRLNLRMIQLLLAAVLVIVAGPSSADLESDIRGAIHASGLIDAGIGIAISDPDAGMTLARINEYVPMIPASNMKLLSAGAALHILGPTFEFRTRLILDNERLIVVGDGDPGFGDPELLTLIEFRGRQGMDVETFLDLWAEAVIEAGVRHLDEVVVDDRIFDREFVHPDWPRDQLNRRYCAEASGLIFHANVLHFYPRPQRSGPPDVSRFEPYAAWVDLSANRATCNAQVGNTIGIARPFGANKFTFFGNVSQAYTNPVPVTVHDMPDFFARLLTERLRARGVTVKSSGAIALEKPVSIGRVVGPTIRTPISTALIRCNRDSQNLYAEALAKRSGHALTQGAQPGSWANAAAAIRFAISERLNDLTLTRGLIVSDSSGLSRENRVTAALLTAWLDSFHGDSELGPIFIDSLAVGGVSGTLEDRFQAADFRRVTVHAKSGYINGVSCLSGYVTSSDGRRRSFSILINDIPGGKVSNAKQLQETIVALIAESLGAFTGVDVGG